MVAVINNRNNNHRTANISRCVCPCVRHTASRPSLLRRSSPRRSRDVSWTMYRLRVSASVVEMDFASVQNIGNRDAIRRSLMLRRQGLGYAAVTTRARAQRLSISLCSPFLYTRVYVLVCVHDVWIHVCICVCLRVCR